MQWNLAKIKAQAFLISHPFSAYFVSLFTLLCQVFLNLAFLFCSLLCGFVFRLLPQDTSLKMKILFSVFFFCAALFSLFLSSLFPFLKARWFLKNQKERLLFRQFFSPVSLTIFWKASFLELTKSFRMLCLFIGYFLPFFLYFLWAHFHFRKRDFTPLLFLIVLCFGILLFFLCLSFYLLHVQKYQLLFIVLERDEMKKCAEILKLSAIGTAPYQQKLLLQKMQFFFWFLLSFVPFVLPYAASYYAQTSAVWDDILLKEMGIFQKKKAVKSVATSQKARKRSSDKGLAKVPILRYTKL